MSQLYFHELLPVFLLIQAVYRKQFCELSQGNPHERGKKTLTETDMKIIEISQAVGYDNEKHFMKILKQPVEYLRQNTVTMLIYPNPDEKSVFAGTYVHLPWKIKL